MTVSGQNGNSITQASLLLYDETGSQFISDKLLESAGDMLPHASVKVEGQLESSLDEKLPVVEEVPM